MHAKVRCPSSECDVKARVTITQRDSLTIQYTQLSLREIWPSLCLTRAQWSGADSEMIQVMVGCWIFRSSMRGGVTGRMSIRGSLRASAWASHPVLTRQRAAKRQHAPTVGGAVKSGARMLTIGALH